MAYKQQLESLFTTKNDEFHDVMYSIKMVERAIRNMEDERQFAHTEQEIQLWQEERNDALAYLDDLEEEAGKLNKELDELDEQIQNMAFRYELARFRQIQ